MDVTFTNVLEGARQYFQGLPAASGAAASPSAVTVSYTGESQQVPSQPQQQQQQQATSHTSHTSHSSHYYPNYSHAHESVLHYTPSAYMAPQSVQSVPQQAYSHTYQQHTQHPQHTQHTQLTQNQTQQQQTYHTHQFTPHSYSPHTPTHSYHQPQTSKPSATHNLPPIAALSNYHASKTQNVRAIPSRTLSNSTVTTSAPATTSRIPQYSQSNTYDAYSTSHTSQSNQNGPTTYPYHSQTSSQSYTTTAPSYSSTSGTSYSQSSYSQHYQKAQKAQYQTSVPYQSTSREQTQVSVTQITQARTEAVTTILTKHKRESPLDLSVKTVRTSADSTALDEDVHSSERKYMQNRSMPPPMQVPNSVPYQYDQRNTVRTSSASTGAPKVDFLPNFNVSSMQRHDNNRQIIQQNDKRNMSYSNKLYYHHQQQQQQQQQLQQQQHQNQQHQHQQHQQPQQQSSYHHAAYPQYNNVMPNTAHPYSAAQVVPKRTNDQVLPRIDFPTPGHTKPSTIYSQTATVQRKRPAEPVQQVVPNKMPKMDIWRQTIDQQIEQRLNSYANSKKFEQQYGQTTQQHHVQQQQPKAVNNVQKVVNGNMMPNHHRSREMYPTYNQNHTAYSQTQYANNNQYHMPQNHNQTYVPTAMGHHNYMPNHSQQDMYQQSVLQRTNSNPKLLSTSPVRNNNLQGADKRVLSILRNSLEIKGAKEAQKKLEQQPKPEMHRSGIQQPSTDVTAPLQPKPGIIGRQNISPFPAANLLERNSNTPPIYKFHFPRAVDSVSFETDTITKDNPLQTKQEMYSENIQNNAGPPTGASSGTSDLDGLAAFLAARIRTKAELKQVGTNQISSLEEKNDPHIKTKDKSILLPRRRLFSRSEEEPNTASTAPGSSAGSCAPQRDSALRSSSETSVFDFRDSDSEGEMSVLERQSLDDMRKAKSMNKTQQIIPSEDKLEETVVEIKIEEDLDPFWSDQCDKFLEQLKTTGGKKRGRRKKVIEPDVLAKLETVTKENPIDNINLEAVVKLENIDQLSQEACTSVKKEEPVVVPKVENDSDSDVPLARRKPLKTEQLFSDEEDSSLETRKDKIGAKIKIEYSSDSDSDSETISEKLKKLKENKEKTDSDKGMVLRSADSSPKKINPLMKKKAIFGDGSDFHPGWEEEVYKYKRSLRMPARLINISSAPHWHRMSTSLPDLDPCSPAASSLTDDTEFSNRRSMPSFSESKLKRDILDSDMDSNSSFTFNYSKAYDSEEASCSSLRSSMKKEDKKNKENNNILDVLVERYSKYKRKKNKGKEQKSGPKIIPKSKDPLELLPTPSLGIVTPEKESKPRGRPRLNKEENKIEMSNSVYFFFRKETVNNFRDTFKKTSGFMGMDEPFSTVVLKSRTRTETRVMKQRATIREVFGEERPASAPPIPCREDDNLDSSQDSILENKKDTKPQIQATVKTKKENLSPTRTGLRSASGKRPNKLLLTKKLQRGRKRNNLLKVLANKKINSEEEVKEIKEIKSETPSIKSETPSVDGDDNNSEVTATIPTKKRLKLTKMRRKFSSGFDYIRKKKKQVKKEDVDGTVKTKRRGMLPRPSPESVQDIQREIKTWVMNKGVGESHLHRAARLGYTDVTAYCLEKMDCIPSPKDNAGYTPLHEACSRGHLDIARLLLQYGANVSESAQGGIRPLHEAAENGFVEIVRLLLSYGADPMLATYSGLTPLSLATEEETKSMLKHYMADMEGLPAPPWSFNGPAACFDPEESGHDALSNAPSPEPVPEDSDLEVEISEQQLPNLYILRGEPQGDRWILLQDLALILKIKSRDTLLKQISSGPSTTKSIFKELKFSDFLEQARCCTLLCGNEKLNVRSSKIALVKYTDKVKQLLGVERVVVTSR